MGPRGFIFGLALMALVAVFAAAMATAAEAASPEKRDFFGTVVSISGNTVTIETDDGTVDVTTDGDTKVRLPQKRDAGIDDLFEGDSVAVSLGEDDGSAAGKIFVIPGKTKFRQIAGEVVSAPDGPTGAVTIRLPGEDSETVTFNIGDETKLKYRHGATELANGLFVVVLAKRDGTGEVSLDAIEINVAAGKRASIDRRAAQRPDASQDEDDDTDDENEANVRGRFEGIDRQGRWIIGGTPVSVDRRSVVANGLVAGAIVEVEGRLSVDGSLVARRIEAEDRRHSREGSGRDRRSRLEGVFEGTDADGNWIVSGRKIAVGQGADTDGRPRVGQEIRVDALVRSDGRLEAREIENRVRARVRAEVRDRVGEIVQQRVREQHESRLRGVFEGLDENGNWVVNGVSISVDEETRLDGTPAVGKRVDVRAVLREGKILARRIEGKRDEAEDDGASGRAKREAILSGIVERIESDGSLVVNGHRIAITALSDVDGDFQRGARVRIKAAMNDDGTLVARDVDEDRRGSSREGQPDASRGREMVRIEGTVQRINDDGTVLINGIPVLIRQLQGPLALLNDPAVRDRIANSGGELPERLRQVLQVLKEGVVLKIEGVMRPDGTVVATDVKADHRFRQDAPERTSVNGVVDRVIERDGKIVAIVVNGREIRVEVLTDLEGGRLRRGAQVEIDGVLRGGSLFAAEIESDHEIRESIDADHERFHHEVRARHEEAHEDVATEHARRHEEAERKHRQGHEDAEARHTKFHEERGAGDPALHDRFHSQAEAGHHEVHEEAEARHARVHHEAEARHEEIHEEAEAKHDRIHEALEAHLDTVIDEAHDEDNDGVDDLHDVDEHEIDTGVVEASVTDEHSDSTVDDGSDDTVAGVEFKAEGTVAKFSDFELVLDDGTFFLIDADTRIDDPLEVGALVVVEALETRDGVFATRISVVEYAVPATDVNADGSVDGDTKELDALSPPSVPGS